MVGRFPQDGYTDLVGRRDELAQIAAMLAESRLVTIVGPGGVGKTRVARTTASERAARYADGPWIVELSNLRDPALLPNTVASVLGLPEQDTRSALDAVLEYLRDRQVLLILDTCEHLLEACAALSQAVLRYAADVTVLATSRQPLDTSGETVFSIGPLPVPETGWVPSAGESGAGSTGAGNTADAVELLALRASAAAPGFAVTEGNAADVVRLCQRLDGIPLAIELAAVQLRTLPLSELVERLDHRFSVLTGGQPDAPPRHEALRTAIEWSHELCSPDERRLWARLSVFAGRFGLTAVEDVCAEVAIERPDVIGALIGLVDKSVVIREGDQYRMLDTLREFGAEQLTDSGELAACRARHIARYQAMARYFGTHFAEDDQIDKYHELWAVHSNLRAALEYALELDDDAEPGWSGGPATAASGSGTTVAAAVRERWRSGADMACSLYGYWQISGLLGEGGYWLTKALDRFPETGPERARALVNRGFLRSFQGDVHNALADIEAGTEMALELGDDAVAARGYQHLMLTLTFLGRHDDAAKATEEARSRLRACGDRAGELMLMAQWGHLHQLSGRPEECVTVCDEGLEMLGQGNGEQWIRTYLLAVSGFALVHMQGRQDDCDRVLRQALYGKQEIGDVIGMAYSLDALGWLAAKTGAPERTAWLLGAAEPLWERGGSLRFSGTAIMEEFHLHAEKSATAALGAAAYQAAYAAGVAYVRGRLAAGADTGALRLEIP